MKKTAILILMILPLLFSCKKVKEDPVTDYGVAAENSQTQSDFDDMHRIAEDVMAEDDAGMRTDATAACWTSSINTTAKIITVTFDSTLCSDGKTRDGILQITYTGKYRTAGTVITIVPVGYSVNGRTITGKKVVTNQGATGVNGSTRFSVVVSDASGSGFATITYPGGSSATWKSTRTRDWTGGEATAIIYDDVYQINGTGEGISKGGTSYTTTFSDIVIKLACWANGVFYPVAGTVTLTTSDGNRSIDYGNGYCDKTVEYHGLKGRSLTITLD